MSGAQGQQKLSYWWLAVVLVIGLGSCLLQLQAEGYHIRHPDALFYATMARNMVNSGQCATDILLPNQLIGAESIDISGLWPAQLQRIGYPLIVAAAFRILGPTDLACHLVSTVFFLGIVAVVFIFAHRLAGLPAALAAPGLLITHSTLSHEGIVGDLEMAYAFLALLSLYWAWQSRSPVQIAGAGLAIGLAYMIRPTALAFLVAGGLVLWPEEGKPRWRWLALLLAVFLVLSVVGYVVESALTPPPLAPGTLHSNKWAQLLLYSTEAYPGHQAIRGNRLVTIEEIFKHKRAIAEKVVRALRQAYQDVGTWIFIYIIVFAVVGAFNGRQDRRRRSDQLAITLLVLFLLIIAVPVLCYPAGFHRYTVAATVSLVPMAGVGLVILLQRIRERWGKAQTWLIAAFLVGCVLYPRTVDVAEQFVIPNVPFERLVGQKIATATAPGEIIMTDEVDRGVAWYGPRRVVRLPETVEQTMDLCRRAHPVDAIAVAAEPKFFQPPENVPADRWFPGFRLAETFAVSDGVREHQFYLYKTTGDGY